MHENGIT